MSEVHVRTVPTNVEFAEGRLFVRLMPYDVPARVADMTPDGIDVYQEGFRRSAFERQAASVEPGVLRRVSLKHEHDGGLGYLGPLMAFDDRDDGMYGEFRVLPSMRADVAELVELGVNEVSVEFLERRGGTVTEDGVRWRTDVHLEAVALLPKGAYGDAGAGVLSMREIAEHEDEQARVEAEQAEIAAAEAAAEEKRRELAEIDEFLAAAKDRQAELAEKFA